MPAEAGEVLAAVRQLWRANSATLGFMPDGAFEEAARSRHLLAAMDDSEVVRGYLMCRENQRRQVTIAHLCVDPTTRGHGVARLLFEELLRRADGCYDIIARCRDDFPAHEMWPKLGFHRVRKELGRGRDPKPLTVWRYEIEELPILKLLSSRTEPGPTPVVIDANVFFDLDESAPGRAESLGLLEDWLRDAISLHLTAEIDEEIDRGGDATRRAHHSQRAEEFPHAHRDGAAEAAALDALLKIMPPRTSASDISDAKQLAQTIAAGITYFVTRDSDILELSDDIEDRFGIFVVSPHEVINEWDRLRREEAYRPRRLAAGPGLHLACPSANDLEAIASLAHDGQPAPEPRNTTTARLRDLFADPKSTQFECVSNGAEIIAAYAIQRPNPLLLAVPFFAVAPSSLGRTIARDLAERFVAMAAHSKRQVIRVANGGRRTSEALIDAGFSPDDGFFTKLSIATVASMSCTMTELASIGALCPELAGLCARTTAQANRARNHAEALDVERALWPAKISGVGTPCFVVPIEPQWAKELFDKELALGTLFGANPKLMLSCEHAYYRRPMPAVLSAPSRVLWYVSSSKQYPGSMAIRAASYIDEVLVTPSKVAYRRFRRLGVFEWADINRLASGDRAEVMAFRFSGTEQFTTPIDMRSMHEVFEKHGHGKFTMQSPMAISEECYLDLYSVGMGSGTAD